MGKSILFVLLALFIHSGSVLADLQSDQDRAILIAAQADTTLTKVEKLFDHRCEMIRKYLGFDDSVTGQAIRHSYDKTEIGISLYAGKDLGEHSPESVAEYFKKELAKHHVNAKVFIHQNHPYGTSMAFYINGSSWLKKPVDPLKGIEKIKGLAAETLLILYTEGRLKEWPKEALPPKKKTSTEEVTKTR
ncbi:MAG: hypothetical protein COB14_09300 [Alphaproteobacteria bacterium]|nr:MAG: hypothetical protein COB14_09300 [Alphaproteobacteria bacterium]